MSKRLKEILSYVLIIVGTILASFSVACILLPNDAIDYGSYTFTYYKNGRAKTLKKTFKPNPMGTKKTQTLTFTYTKMAVPANQTDTIADQQWQFINGDGVVGFAW